MNTIFTQAEMDALEAMNAYYADAPAPETWIPKAKAPRIACFSKEALEKLAVMEKRSEGAPVVDEMPGWLENQRYVDPFPVR